MFKRVFRWVSTRLGLADRAPAVAEEAATFVLDLTAVGIARSDGIAARHGEAKLHVDLDHLVIDATDEGGGIVSIPGRAFVEGYVTFRADDGRVHIPHATVDRLVIAAHPASL